MAVDDLFDLIKVLTPSEKRYFKIHAKTHVGDKYKNSYEKLFDAINYWPDEVPYDEKVFKRKHKGKAFLKNLSVEKNYLYELILETLRNYQAENKQEIRLHQFIADLRLLYDKGMLEQGKKLIDKAYILAEESEQIPYMITLCQFKDRFTRYRQTKEEEEQARKNFKIEKQLLLLLEAERNIAHIRREIFNLYTSGKLIPEIPNLKNEIAKWEQSTKNLQPTSTATRYLYTCKALIAEKESDYISAMQYYEKLLPLAEKQIKLGKEPAEYARPLLSNYLVCAHYCQRYDLFEEIINRITDLPAHSPREKAEVFIHTYQYKLLYQLNVRNTSDCAELINDIEKGMLVYHSFLSAKTEINIRMNICVLLLQNGEYEKLIPAINHIFTLTGRDDKYLLLIRDLRFMEIIAQYSLQQTDLLNYSIRNTERWLDKHSLSNNYTKKLLAVVKKTLKAGGNLHKAALCNIENHEPETQMLKALFEQWERG